MKKFALMLAGLGTVIAAVPASAQAWVNIDARQERLDGRIDQGIRSGALTRPEATRLRGEFRSLSRLEQRYRAGGLSNWERRDLNRRYDALAARVRLEKQDRQDRRYR
jgi:hypothetical protein